ncbi:hypothetical protein BDW68DRAFT_180011 [Aspergillus falconensis]
MRIGVVAEVIAEWPFWKLTAYICTLINSVTQESLDAMLDMVSIVRDKSTLNIRVDPPDGPSGCEYHRGRLWVWLTNYLSSFLARVTNGVIVIYPPRTIAEDSDEECEFAIFYGEDLAQTLIDDPEWNAYFEY